MLRIVPQEIYIPADPPEQSPTAEESAAPEDFEIVLGRRQIASLLFVVVVLLAVCSGVSYMAGKASTSKRETPSHAETVPAASLPPILTAQAAPVSQPAPVSAPPPAAVPAVPASVSEELDAALFADPVPGARYLQVGAVDRGVAVILTEGLRSRGLNGFIAHGPQDNIYRVLVGPFRTNAEYLNAKDAVDRMKVATFTRTYDQ